LKTLGIVAEYNPFHNGHKYHMQKSRELTGANRTVVVMSSTFTQRGEPAICDKWSRGEMAIKEGADLVLELPLPFSCSSADFFARGAVKILSQAGCTHIAFGSEHPNLERLKEIAHFIEKEPPGFQEKLRQHLKEGHSFPKSRSLALEELLELDPEIINSPNNILAIEYLRTIHRDKLSLIPVPVKRRGTPYLSTSLTNDFPSATAIRNSISKNKSLKGLKNYIPPASYNILSREINRGGAPVFSEDFAPVLLGILRGTTGKNLSSYPEIAPGLENRLVQTARQAIGWNNFLEKLQTRCFVQTRLQRIFVYILLELTQSFREEIKFPNSPLYFRPLAFNKKGREILHKIKEIEDFPLITRPTIRRLPRVSEIKKMIDLEARATDFWGLFCSSPEYKKGGRDFRTPPVFLD